MFAVGWRYRGSRIKKVMRIACWYLSLQTFAAPATQHHSLLVMNSDFWSKLTP
jgi:hypothetical protein